MAWGLEARVPFLDKEFLDVAMSIYPEWKMVRGKGGGGWEGKGRMEEGILGEWEKSECF